MKKYFSICVLISLNRVLKHHWFYQFYHFLVLRLFLYFLQIIEIILHTIPILINTVTICYNMMTNCPFKKIWTATTTIRITIRIIECYYIFGVVITCVFYPCAPGMTFIKLVFFYFVRFFFDFFIKSRYFIKNVSFCE